MPERPARLLIEASLQDLLPDPRQPRRHFDEEPLQELARSIARYGVLQPLLVTPLQDATMQSGSPGARFRIVAGERRWRAALRAGLRSVPALVLQVDGSRGREVALIENLHRSDLRPLELAQALETIIRQQQLTQEELAQRLGKSRVAITNTLRLLHLGYLAQQALSTGRISEGHARALLGVNGVAQEQALAETLARDLTVRQTEALVRRRAGARLPRRACPESADLRYVADALRQVLCTRVLLEGSEQSGRMVIEYHSHEELERLCQQIGGAAFADALG
ncbi:MAG TPA: ParB/RepB/Spo0J family partition protein [Chloroflexota bacterium]|jgi:ParB family chromosome partitioning protein|nr:ParB/RepB/Spo0J family partition protein [Chloroflexota bacterium]